MINYFGWRNAWIICGSFGIIVGFLCIFTVYEPPRSDRIEIKVDEDEDQDNKSSFIKKATQYLERDSKNEYVATMSASNVTVINIKKKQKTIKELCKEYANGFRLLFTNCAAVLILIGCSLRLWETGIIGFYQ